MDYKNKLMDDTHGSGWWFIEPLWVIALMLPSHESTIGFQFLLGLVMVGRIWILFRMESLIRPTLTLYTLEGLNYLTAFLSIGCIVIWIANHLF